MLWMHSLPPPLSSTNPDAATVSVPLVRAFGVLIEWHLLTPAHYRHSYLTAYITAIEELHELAAAVPTAPSTALSVGCSCVSVRARARRSGRSIDFHVPVRAYEHFLPGAASNAFFAVPGIARSPPRGWWLRCVPTGAADTRRVQDHERAPIPAHYSDSLAPLAVWVNNRSSRLDRVYLYSTDHTKIRLTPADRKNSSHKEPAAESKSGSASTQSKAGPEPNLPVPLAADQLKPRLLTRSEPTPMLSVSIVMPPRPPVRTK
jgi:hypothetical protein